MRPLSCVNCCHNPLQLGRAGTDFGYCTRHLVVLPRPESTTCGQLFRKDLSRSSAVEERALHQHHYRCDRISQVVSPKVDAAKVGLVEKTNGFFERDVVLEEVLSYAQYDTNISTMAALRRVEGARAEIAMLSLSRGYLANCYDQQGPWWAGLHLAFWTLQRLDTEPVFAASELHGPMRSVAETTAVAKWRVLAFRLYLLVDVSDEARSQSSRDPITRFTALADEALSAGSPTRPEKVLAKLRSSRTRWMKALSKEHYARLRNKIRRLASPKIVQDWQGLVPGREKSVSAKPELLTSVQRGLTRRGEK